MHKLKILSNQLDALNFPKESKYILKIANSQDWIKVINAVTEPVEEPIILASKQLTESYNTLLNNYQKISGLNSSDLLEAIKLAMKMPKGLADKSASIDFNKYSESIITDLGSKALRIIPLIGFIFSFGFALKNFIYAILTFHQILEIGNPIGLNGLNSLDINTLKQKVSQYQNDPDNLITVSKVTNYSKYFYDEAISLMANGLDFIKDIIFVFIDSGSFGLSTIGDIGLSIFFMYMEYITEQSTFKEFDDIRLSILKIADQALSKDYEISDDQILKWIKE